MDLVKCAAIDVPRLAEMNRQLIVDEKSDNPMDDSQLETRMRGFLAAGYEAYFFRTGQDLVGYALVDANRQPLYLRQFLILRQYRRQGLGAEAFRLLLETLGVREIDIEVLSANQPGQKFWESLGFHERSRYMRYQAENTFLEMGM